MLRFDWRGRSHRGKARQAHSVPRTSSTKYVETTHVKLLTEAPILTGKKQNSTNFHIMLSDGIDSGRTSAKAAGNTRERGLRADLRNRRWLAFPPTQKSASIEPSREAKLQTESNRKRNGKGRPPAWSVHLHIPVSDCPPLRRGRVSFNRHNFFVRQQRIQIRKLRLEPAPERRNDCFRPRAIPGKTADSHGAGKICGFRACGGYYPCCFARCSWQ